MCECVCAHACVCACMCVCKCVCVCVDSSVVGGATECVCVVNLSVGGCIYLHVCACVVYKGGVYADSSV